jgi:hypothetical protein
VFVRFIYFFVLCFVPNAAGVSKLSILDSPLPENCENRNDPDLVQAFLKKWWVESDFKASNLSLSLRLKVSGCHYNVFDIYFTEFGADLTTVLPVLFKYCCKYCYSDNRKL